ncbi:GPO family capsid scaffolding protein [Qipengyuania flava]|uniref:GPO family capsid scaffolding protein n=1 Tax=Qipengyuania flava TaxID=192812 RepID=UPI00273D3CBD|nr:GPO family capsid scaffolding protein [Qipengyuania flava]
MKTKPFLLATAGATVDGRTIDAAMLQQMADSYDPATYAARLNIEHFRGIMPTGPFGAYGDVVELSTEEVTVNFNGKDEKRLGLYGVFEVTEDAKALNDAGQKLYPSIEINPNFADKGFAYLMGCALTDSPASIATDRMQFNRKLPGALTLGTDKPEQAFALEFADADGKATEAGEGLVAKFGAMLDSVFAKHAPKTDDTPKPKTDDTPKPKTDDTPAGDFSQLRPLFDGFAQDIAGSIDGLRSELRGDLDQFGVRLKAVEKTAEDTPSETYRKRPPATGSNAGFSGF